jgi:large subunit ribosomal protein L23
MSTRPHYQVVLGPVVTEKTTGLKEKSATLCFRVHPGANKIDIKRAVEALFKVKVDGVRTANVHGKFKRRGKTAGYQSDWKKAYVTLKEGEKMIEYFEGA